MPEQKPEQEPHDFSRAAEGRRTFICYCYCYYSIDGRVLSKSQSLQVAIPPRFRGHFPPSQCRLPALCHRAARSLQPRRPLVRTLIAACCSALYFRISFVAIVTPQQPQRLLNADFVLQPRQYLSFVVNVLRLPLVIVRSQFLPSKVRAEPNIV